MAIINKKSYNESIKIDIMDTIFGRNLIRIVHTMISTYPDPMKKEPTLLWIIFRRILKYIMRLEMV